MIKFRYKAKDKDNRVYKGIISSNSISELREILSYKDLYLIRYKKIEEKKFKLRGKIDVTEISYFCNQMKLMIRSGLNLDKSLEIIKTSMKVKRFKDIIDDVSKEVKSGKKLSESFDKYRFDFPNHFISMIKVGERSGKLDVIFDNLAKYFEKNKQNKQKLIQALTYPLTLIGMGVLVLIFLLIKIVPIFGKIFTDMNAEIPKITRILMLLSDHFKNYYIYYLSFFLIILTFFLLFRKKRKVKKIIDRVKIRIPIVNKIYLTLYSLLFSDSLLILLNSGAKTVESIDLISCLVGNMYLEEKIKKASKDIEKGISIASSISNINYFSDTFIEMINIGEKSGEIINTLSLMNTYYASDYEYQIKKLIGKVEPILILIIGGIIMIMLLAVFLPMLGIMNSIQI